MANLAIQSGLALALLTGAARPANGAPPMTPIAQQNAAAVNGDDVAARDSAPLGATSDSATLGVRTRIKGATTFTGVAWSPNGGTLSAYANFGRSLEIWSARGTELKQLSRAGAYIGHSIEFMHDSRTMVTPAADDSAAGDKLALTIWDVDRGEIAQNVVGPQPAQNWRFNRAVALALSPDDAMLALISFPLFGQPVTLYATKVWTIERKIPIGERPAHPGGAEAMAFSPDGRTLGIGLLGGKVMLLDMSRPDAPARTIEIYPAANLTGAQALAIQPGRQVAGDRFDQAVGRAW
jgi:WD40 repeat protein